MLWVEADSCKENLSILLAMQRKEFSLENIANENLYFTLQW